MNPDWFNHGVGLLTLLVLYRAVEPMAEALRESLLAFARLMRASVKPAPEPRASYTTALREHL